MLDFAITHAKKSKYIETEFHFIQNKKEVGTISIHCVPTGEMAAVIATNYIVVSKVKAFKAVYMEAYSKRSAHFCVDVLKFRF